jgi:predicted GIY-YIG superfamily endonuclease
VVENLSPNVFHLVLSESRIASIMDSFNESNIGKFKHPLTSNQYKIYVLTDSESILYVGTTKSSIKNRLRYGLIADGKNGYHGYNWKGLPLVKLHVWCFEYLDKEKTESIEAELVYLIRRETGKWPIYQNEIHFNNYYAPEAQTIAEKLFKQIR